MSKLKKRTRVLTAFTFALLMSFVVASGVSADAPAEKEPRALTPPPPAEMSIMSLNPSNVYLTDASTSIRKSGSNIQISSNTYASRVVDSIGANIYLQRWTGSVWVDVESSFNKNTNSSSYYGTKTWQGVSGYYYRGKTVHWVKEGTKYEEVVTHSSTILM
ncbi:hypothetical protein [Paenibacillus faecalis]|uniref:hypothetical protein n=1 Tax=Paenibacillus faecalis TaxID=2079532 RepID=UPI000D0E59F0|nr:hypothetical protein [Paenibacillus faecalis]